MTRVLIFDFDGVLADSLSPMLHYAGKVCRELGVPRIPTRADLEALERMEFSEFGRQLGVPADQIDRFVMRNFELFSEREVPLEITSGMQAILTALAIDNQMAIITGNSCSVVEKFLETYQIKMIFDSVLCAEHEGTRFEKILQVKRQFDAQGNEIYMIGDAVSDIRAAREAGVKSVAAAWGHQSRTRLAGESPDLLIDHPEHLLEYFSNQHTHQVDKF
jgi:phosphoglycolate phosphatase